LLFVSLRRDAVCGSSLPCALAAPMSCAACDGMSVTIAH